jgi:hypothetical protein
MSAENVVPVVIVLWLLYVILRFISFEILTVVLRRVAPARNWLRKQNAKGRLLRDSRSSPLFAVGMRWVGDAQEWIVGRGWRRAPTFVLIAAITIFLANLPVDRGAEARAQYEAAYASVRDFEIERETEMYACLVENGLAVVKARTGVVMTAPVKFYPVGSLTSALMAETNGVRAMFLLKALFHGRVLTDQAGEAPQTPLERRYWSAVTRDGRFIGEGYRFLPQSPESEAAATDLRALCDFDPATRGVEFRPVRDPADYAGMLARARLRILAFLGDAEVRGAYNTFQVNIFVIQLAQSFFVALGAAFVLWISARLAIAICRSPAKRAWLIVNYCLVASLSVAAHFTASVLLGMTRNATEIIASAGLFFALIAAPTPSAEADYRQHVNAVVGRALDLVEPTCAELAPQSPLFGWCQLMEVMAEPWNRETRSFDFSGLFSASGFADNQRERWALSGLNRLAMTVHVTMVAVGARDYRQNDDEIALWKGMRFGSLALIMALPFIMVVTFATLLALLLDLRWTVVKRVGRIVR